MLVLRALVADIVRKAPRPAGRTPAITVAVVSILLMVIYVFALLDGRVATVTLKKTSAFLALA